MCPSVVGGLPVAVLVTTREDKETISFGLELLKSVLPPFAFYGRGPRRGPVLFMTDDAYSLRSALSCSWALAYLLLCIFHVLQVETNTYFVAGPMHGSTINMLVYSFIRYILNHHLVTPPA